MGVRIGRGPCLAAALWALSACQSAASPPAADLPYMRRSPKVDEVLPILYLRGCRRRLPRAIPALLGEDAAGLSPTTITR